MNKKAGVVLGLVLVAGTVTAPLVADKQGG